MAFEKGNNLGKKSTGGGRKSVGKELRTNMLKGLCVEEAITIMQDGTKAEKMAIMNKVLPNAFPRDNNHQVSGDISIKWADANNDTV